MNDLGMTLAWSAIQVTLVLAPAALFHALASRRSAASGSWMATVGLALSIAIGTASFVPWPRPNVMSPAASTAVDDSARGRHENRGENTGVPVSGSASTVDKPGRLGVSLSRAFDGLLGAWRRLGPATHVPAARFRPWGSVLAVAGIAGTAVGLLRLILGLAAVGLCRQRGKVVNDPILTGLSHEIRLAMGCHRAVEIREVPDLTAPATAGWWHPVIMLPDGWSLWDDADRRAVLAHELAHIHRWDYAAGLIARLAVALQFYHPLVHWMAQRLQLQQELVADAVGARFAGGRGLYLLTLSRLALEQDGRSPSWPARAFLPARGTLIRRIAMLQNEHKTVDRPWSRSRRLLAGLCLLGAAIGVAMLRGPARGDESEKHPDAVKAEVPTTREGAKGAGTAFDLRYVSDDMQVVIAFRPAATVRRTGMPSFDTLCELAGFDLSETPKRLKIELSAPGRLQLGLNDIDWVVSGVHFGRGSKNREGQATHGFGFGTLTVRTTKAFDWLRFLREWRLEFTDAQHKGHAYFKIIGIMKPLFETNPCVYLPDDRTIVFDEEAAIQKMLGRENPIVPAHLAGADWEQVSRGLLAVAIDNRDGRFAKGYAVGQPDEALVLPVFVGVDHWILGFDDEDATVFRASAKCRDDASEKVAGSVKAIVKLAKDRLGHRQADKPSSDSQERAWGTARSLVQNLRIGQDGRSVALRSEGFGTLAEFFSLMDALFKLIEYP